jgi:VWFA-related protein
MKSVLLAVVLLLFGAVAANGQSCLTKEDVKGLLARIESSAPVDSASSKTDKKIQTELLKLALRQRELLQEVVAKDQEKKSDRDKLHKLYEQSAEKLCDILKTSGWPTSATVGTPGIAAAFYILKNGGTHEMQRDLLPVIVAAIKKDPAQKPEFAGLFDRLRVSAGMKQLFGTQVVSLGGFLVLYPVEDQKHLDDRRAEFGLPKMEENIRNLERLYGRPLIKSRQAPTSQLSKELTDSLTNAIGSADVGGTYVDPGDVIKTETSLVSINVSVFNSKLKEFVGSLTKEDFHVVEDGKEQTVTYFASTDVPFDLVLLVDLSGSTAEKRDLIKSSTLRFIEAARPSDRLAIVTFSDEASVISPLTLDRAQLKVSVDKIEGLGSSKVWDAVKFVFDNVVGGKTLERRRAVVLMSDGVDNALYHTGGPLRGSTITFAELLEQIRQSDTLIVPIYLDTEVKDSPWMKEEYENARRTLKLMAQESGGSYYQARKLSDLNGVYEQVINDLGKVYSLGYKSTNPVRDSSWRSVHISIVNRPDLITHARPGYYAQ